MRKCERAGANQKLPKGEDAPIKKWRGRGRGGRYPHFFSCFPTPPCPIQIRELNPSQWFSTLYSVAISRSIMLAPLCTNLSSGVLAKYSLSIKPSILFLMTWGLGMNRAFNCSVTCLQQKKMHYEPARLRSLNISSINGLLMELPRTREFWSTVYF